MYARPEDYALDVPATADGLGAPFPCRRMVDKCVQITPFTGTILIRASVDEVNWPIVHEETGGAADGAFVALPLAVRAIRLEFDGVGGSPTARISGVLMG